MQFVQTRPLSPFKKNSKFPPSDEDISCYNQVKSGSCSTISWRKDLHQIATQQTIIAAQLVFCHLAMQNPTQNGCSIPLSKILSPSVQDVLIKGLSRSIAVSEKYVYIYICVYTNCCSLILGLQNPYWKKHIKGYLWLVIKRDFKPQNPTFPIWCKGFKSLPSPEKKELRWCSIIHDQWYSYLTIRILDIKSPHVLFQQNKSKQHTSTTQGLPIKP